MRTKLGPAAIALAFQRLDRRTGKYVVITDEARQREIMKSISPVNHVTKDDAPTLIIHGDADSNPGTLTAQSEVFFEAVRGSGGTARLVLLPHEDHGYRARENVEHVLWEQLEWFDKYVKNAGKDAQDG